MSTYAMQRRSNRDVARIMLIGGIALVVLAVGLDFFATSIIAWLNELGPSIRETASRLWTLAIRLGYSVGPILIVGAIIVNRLPEQTRQEQPPAT
jgi:H+/Cl- antiporter ClcA